MINRQLSITKKKHNNPFAVLGIILLTFFTGLLAVALFTIRLGAVPVLIFVALGVAGQLAWGIEGYNIFYTIATVIGVIIFLTSTLLVTVMTAKGNR